MAQLNVSFNWAIILQYFTLLNYELFCKRNGIPLPVAVAARTKA